MKNGFTLVTTIMFLVLVATVSMLALSLTVMTNKQTSDLYLREQADLLLYSGIEFALLAISGHEINATNNNCLNQVNARFPDNTNPLFDINVTIHYLGSGLPTGLVGGVPRCNILSNTVATADSNLTVIIDTTVSSVAGVTTEPIRLHRRTLQKP